MACSKNDYCVADGYERLENDYGKECDAPGSRVTEAEQPNRDRDPNQTYGDIPLDFCCEDEFEGERFTRLRDVVAVVAPSVGTCNDQEDISC